MTIFEKFGTLRKQKYEVFFSLWETNISLYFTLVTIK